MGFLTPFADKLLSVLRIVTSLLFIEHGTQKMFNFPPAKEPKPFNPTAWPSGPAGILEVVGGGMLLFGLFSRPVAFILSGQMAIAYWIAHAKRGPFPVLNGGDGAIMFCFIFLYIAAVGGGPLSLDAMLGKKSAPAA